MFQLIWRFVAHAEEPFAFLKLQMAARQVVLI